MNYINAMKKLEAFEQNKKIINSQKLCASNAVYALDSMTKVSDAITSENIVNSARTLAEAHGKKKLEDTCNALGIECTKEMTEQAVAYEKSVQHIQSTAREEIEKGTSKPLSQSPGKIVGLLFSGCAAFAFFLCSFMFSSMEDSLISSDLSSTLNTLALISLGIFLALLCFKKKINTEALNNQAKELKTLTQNYVLSLQPIFSEAFSNIETRYDAQLKKMQEEIIEEVGETFFFLYENTPYGQKEYFRNLGMTATEESDFNEIAKECLKAEKTDQQIALQNQISIETRNEINRGIDKLNQTARRIEEDAKFHAAQTAAQNSRLAEQNELSLKNQAKTLGELKKQTKLSSDLEYKVRQMQDKIDD